MTIKILALSGSQRAGSSNSLLVRAAAAGAEAEGAHITVLDWAAYDMPLYDPDREKAEGFPDAVLRFKALLRAHQGFLIASPEYNGSLTPLLKNAIDWASRPAAGEPPMACYKHKVIGLLSTSPGVFGGVTGLVHLRAILSRLGSFVIPEQYPVGEAGKLFDESGAMRDPKLRAIAEGIGARTAKVLKHWPDATP
ncbi:NAD(P)H-dependent oxidoreductase [Nevskia sp.]|uniref:NADPH-dependent FMN reductase n=1 Tax=Nevskia sp. TaxID=1929292 RepID=UPI0025FE0669|nr:NAD(P)H-dependent oxidoreductase [Nevskia sp.]